MRLLLDSNVLLWLVLEPQRVSTNVERVLSETESRSFLSIVSTWEISIKTALGKLDLPKPPLPFFEEAMERLTLDLLLITIEQTAAVAELPHHHRDPFDRLLIAQAQSENLTLVTSDQNIARYDVDVLW